MNDTNRDESKDELWEGGKKEKKEKKSKHNINTYDLDTTRINESMAPGRVNAGIDSRIDQNTTPDRRGSQMNIAQGIQDIS